MIIMLVWVLANEPVWISAVEGVSSFKSEAGMSASPLFCPCCKGEFPRSFVLFPTHSP